MPPLRTDTTLSVKVEVFQPDWRILNRDFTVKDKRDDTKDFIDNTTAVCFLVNASQTSYTRT